MRARIASAPSREYDTQVAEGGELHERAVHGYQTSD
jgi:hypothetical protein